MRFALVWSEAASGLRRNVTMVVSVVLVTFISLTFVGAAILLQMQIGQMKGYWYDKAQVAVYMCTATDTGSPNCQNGEAGPDQIAAVKKALNGPTLAQYINKVSFENHQQAYRNFEKQFKDNPVADSVTPEYLNQTFWVNLKNPSQSDVIAESLANTPGVQSVVDQRSYLQPIFNVLNAASYTAIGIASLMLVAAVLLIATTIRLSAISRRRELGIMRLVGASNRFIRTPFILEGVFAALVGSVLAGAVVIAIVYFFVHGYLAARIASIAFVGFDSLYVVVPVLLVVGVVLAAISANVAISRYLKV
jgi:cell division transport system permease protein